MRLGGFLAFVFAPFRSALREAEIFELAVERGAADLQSPRDLRHLPAIMRDGEADHLGLEVLERQHVAVVVEMIRTSTLTVFRPPTGSTSPSWMARSNFTCAAIGNSPTSSRNSVPPEASTNLPRCFSVAPVKAPFSWPNR